VEAAVRGAAGGSERGVRLARLALLAAPWLVLTAAGVSLLRNPAARTSGRSLPTRGSPAVFDAVEPGRGRLAARPTAIPGRGWRDILWRTLREAGDDRLSAVAGGVTFYALLAVFPGLGVFVSLYGLFSDVTQAQEQLVRLAAFAPGPVVQLIGEQMVRIAGQKHAELSVAFVVGLLFSAWSASAAMRALCDGLNVAYDETERRSFVRRMALTYGMTLGLLVFAALVSGVLVAVPNWLRSLGLAWAEALWTPALWLILAVLAASAFTAVYRYGPSREEARWRWVWPGGVSAALAWLVGSLGYSWYLNHVVRLDVTYGSLGAVMGFMLWIWFSALVVLIGAELNAEIEHQTALDSTTGAPQPMGGRGASMADTVGVAFHPERTVKAEWGRIRSLFPRRGQPNSSSRAARRAA